MIRAAIIGCGNIAGGYGENLTYKSKFTHAGVIEGSEGFKLVAACDVDKDQLSKFCNVWSVNKGYTDFREMVSKEDIDLVIISSPANKHFECIDYLGDSDVSSIFCEKPLTETFEQANRLKDRIKNKIFCVNFFRKWNESIANLAEDINNKEYGNLISGNVWYTKDLLTNGSHLIHLSNWLFGLPDEIELSYKNREKYSPNFRLVYDNKNLEFQHISSKNYVLLEMDLIFEEGRIRISQRGQAIGISNICLDEDYGFNKLEEMHSETAWEKCLTRAYENIRISFEGGIGELCSFQEGYDVMSVIDTINKKY